MNDAFSKHHPAVNFLFFAGAIGCGVALQHPAYLVPDILCAAVYYLLLGRKKSIKPMALMLALTVFLAAVNPLFNTRGEHILFFVFGRPYTWEALLYGCALSAGILGMLLWFGCYSYVLTADKFTSLFGNLIPSLSLLLVMTLRMVPALMKKARQIAGARRTLGKGSEDGSAKKKLSEGMTRIGILTSWALEGSIVTADSMRARGYGTAKRRSFLIYRMRGSDWVLICLQTALLAAVIAGALSGQMQAVYTPTVTLARASWSAAAYSLYLFIPLALNIKEAILWHISKSRI